MSFIQRTKKAARTVAEIMKNATSMAVGAGIFGAIVIGGPLAIFIAGSGLSAFVFGAALMAGGISTIGFVANMVEGMFTAGGSSAKTNKGMASRALVVAASVTALCFNGVPRAVSAHDTSVSAAANKAFANCPRDKRVTTLTQDAAGRQVVTMTCNK